MTGGGSADGTTRPNASSDIGELNGNAFKVIDTESTVASVVARYTAPRSTSTSEVPESSEPDEQDIEGEGGLFGDDVEKGEEPAPVFG